MLFMLAQTDAPKYVSATPDWAAAAWAKVQAKYAVTVPRVGEKIPYVSTDEVYTDVGADDIYWWTNGFYAGLLWELYSHTGDDQYAAAAHQQADRLDKALHGFVGLHHDVGFMWLHAGVADYRLTGSDEGKRRGLIAANVLAGRYNPVGRYLVSWNEDRPGYVIIDSMMNINILYWASQVTGDPRFTEMAKAHADTVLAHHIRPDGSVYHIVNFDPNTGELVGYPQGQGYAPESSWTRGQAWAIYGFALSYRHTGDARYLDAAKRVANYFLANAALDDNEIPVDFRSPREPVYSDTSAAAIAANGLLLLGTQVGALERPLYEDGALALLKHLTEAHTDFDPAHDGIVQGATAEYHSAENREVNMIYADYFYVEALLKLQNDPFLIW
ncbi:MAG: glycoside hydrolase family 88 protein [Schleiferilactobacillus harbinensis]|jgi:unsaturated chondroitin disaccharide hydrolase|nr:glycoside hydrolase family 88 protein [Schleiferilactobacillus harbinensis]